MLASFLVSAENLSDKSATFQLADRIPVSEIDEIKVINVKFQPEVKPDVKGLIKWEVALPARTRKEFRIEYTVEYPAELRVAKSDLSRSESFVKRKDRSLSDGPTSTGALASPAATPEPAGPQEIYKIIGDLEQSIQK
jgi:hypothetical protein